jgi:hypothetical protein
MVTMVASTMGKRVCLIINKKAQIYGGTARQFPTV